MKRFFISLVLLLIIILIVKFETPDYEWEAVPYRVQYGDTLWSICSQYCPQGVDIWEYIYLVKAENDMESSLIYAGEELTVLIAKERNYYESE